MLTLDPVIAEERRRFRGGAVVHGREGLAAISTVNQMSSANPEQARVRLLSTAFGDLLVARLRSQELVADRRGSMLDDRYADYLQLGIITAGQVAVQQGRGERVLSAGDMYVLDNRVGYRLRIGPPTETMHLYVPERVVRDHGYARSAFAGGSWTAASPSNASSKALGRILASFTTGPDTLEDPARLHVARSLQELSLAALHEFLGAMPSQEGAREMYRTRARAAIDERFADPAFDVAAVATLLGVSVRYLHTLFEGEAIGIGGLLRQTRLRYSLGLLVASRRTRATIASIAAASGFRGEDQFARAFKRAQGMTPSEYRSQSGTAAG